MSTTSERRSQTQPYRDHDGATAFDVRALVLLSTLTSIRSAWPIVTAYLTSVITHLVALSWLNNTHTSLLNKLTSWDGQLFLQIAQHGYPAGFTYTQTGKLTGNNLAFLPLYPALVRSMVWVTGLGYQLAGVLVNQVLLIVLLAVTHKLVRLLHDRHTATITLMLLTCAQPMSIVFLMSYSETLFTTLAIATLLALYRERWLLAGLLSSLAGLTRSIGVATTLAVIATAGVHVYKRHSIGREHVGGVVLSILGTPLYLGWVALRTHNLNGWFLIQQAGWNTHWDWGRSFWAFVTRSLSHSDGWVELSTIMLVVMFTFLTIVSWSNTWVPLAIYGFTIIVMTIGQSNYYHCKLRLLIPTLVFLLPIARKLAQIKSRMVISVLTLTTLFGAWYGAYMLTTWHYAI